MRALLVAFLFAAPVLLAGCFSEEAPANLAKPTSATVMPPVPSPPTREAARFNASDPGYTIGRAWHVGDGWDWESNGSEPRYRTLRVLEIAEQDGRKLYKVEETQGRLGARAVARVTQWVDAASFSLVSSTDASGTTLWYEPAKPLRFYRNATFAFNETGTDMLTGDLLHSEWYYFSFVEPRWEVIRLPWGQVEAFKVVHEGFNGNATARITQWVSPEYANPVRYLADDLSWTLVAADEGGRRLGALQPT